MTESLGAVGIAAVAVFVAEFGDKSQLLVLAFATRHRALPVVAGVVLAALIIQGVSVAIGAVVGALLPTRLVAIVAGASFLAVAAWTLRPDDDEDDAARDAARGGPAGRRTTLSVVLTVAGAFLLAELGDKTMLVTFGLAATHGPLATWVGSVLGEVAANLVAVAVGRQLGSRLDPSRIRLVSAALFLIAGVVVLGGALLAAD